MVARIGVSSDCWLGNTNIFNTAFLNGPTRAAFRALRIGESIALSAMRTMLEYRPRITVTEKERAGDFLTDADTEIQRMAIAEINGQFPNHRFIAEEMFSPDLAASQSSTGIWFLDPIDGTSYFCRKGYNSEGRTYPLTTGFTEYGFQLCYVENNMPKFAIFASPELNIDGRGYSIFEAVEGLGGVFLNGKRVEFSATGPLEGSTAMMNLVGVQNEADLRDHLWNKLGFSRCFSRGGCAHAEFSLLISRREYLNDYNLIGFGALKAWDLIPGAYLVGKSGGNIRHIDGKPVFPFDFGRMGADFKLPPVIAGSNENVNRVFEALKDFDLSQ